MTQMTFSQQNAVETLPELSKYLKMLTTHLHSLDPAEQDKLSLPITGNDSSECLLWNLAEIGVHCRQRCVVPTAKGIV
jgi:hypothetical protein